MPPEESLSLPTECEVCGEPFHAEARWFDEGHDPRCDAEGRHIHYLTNNICPDCRSGIREATKAILVVDSGLVWTAVHGNLLLALRHPENSGPSRGVVCEFVKRLGSLLETEGVLTPNQLRKTYRLEFEAGNEDFRGVT